MAGNDPDRVNPILDAIAAGGATQLSEDDFAALLDQVPSGFDGLSELDLLSQLPTLRQRAAANQRQVDATPFAKRLKSLTRSYRRHFAGPEHDDDRMEPEAILPYVEALETLLAEAQGAGIASDRLLAKCDRLTQTIANTMALLGILARRERN